MIYIGVFWILIGFVLYPAFNTFLSSLKSQDGLTLKYYKDFFSNKNNITVVVNTIKLGLATVLVCGVIGTGLAFYVNYFDFKYNNIINKLLLTPIMIPGVIIVIAFIQLYGESGLITSTIELLFNLDKHPYSFKGFYGILFIHAYTQYVYFYLNVSVSIGYIDYSTIEAAKNLGASKLKIFTSVILPTITPALATSSILTFMSGIGSFSAPNLLGHNYKVLSTQILLAKTNNYMEIASVQVMILLFTGLVFLTLLRHYERSTKIEMSVKGKAIRPVKIKDPKKRKIYMALAGFVILTIILPILTIFLLSFVKPGTWMINIYPKEFGFDNYMKIFTKSRVFAPFKNSISMSLWATFFSLVLGVPCAYIINKTKFKAKGILELLVILPWAMPASTIAINMINGFNKPNIFVGNNILVGTYILLPLAYFVGIIPLMVKTTGVSLNNLNNTLIDASKTLGASWKNTFKKIIIPIISPGIIAGAVLGFIRCVGEYTTSALLYGVANKPISIAMVNALYEFEIGLSMAYGVLIIVITSILASLMMKLRR
ncbi:MAG: iron ABC transporter permease [Firmicutes bacterium]|nr:iron ABC transporter permease [Bacillota bacterium]